MYQIKYYTNLNVYNDFERFIVRISVLQAKMKFITFIYVEM